MGSPPRRHLGGFMKAMRSKSSLSALSLICVLAFGFQARSFTAPGAQQAAPATGTGTDTAATGGGLLGSITWLVKAEVKGNIEGDSLANFEKEIGKLRILAPELTEGHTAYINSRDVCLNRFRMATNLCILDRSPAMQTFSRVLPTLTAGASVAFDQCSSVSKIADALQIGLTTYNAACAGAKAYCDSSCSTATQILNKMSGIVENLPTAWTAKCDSNQMARRPAFCTEATMYPTLASIETAQTVLNFHIKTELAQDHDSDSQSVGYRSKTCGDYGIQLAASIPAAFQLVQKMQTEGDACKKSTDGSKDGAVAEATPLDCSGKDSNTEQCICINFPRTQGCNNSLAKIGASGLSANSVGVLKSSGINAGTGTGSASLGGLELSAPGFAGGGASAGGEGSSTKGGGGSGVGGGGSAGGGGGGGSGNAGTSAEPSSEGFGSLVGGGDTGGGGGGGRGGGRSGGYAANSRLKAYMPGGSKDPKRQLAGSAFPKDITAQAGKSNWEKVRDRYNDNRRSFLGE